MSNVPKLPIAAAVLTPPTGYNIISHVNCRNCFKSLYRYGLTLTSKRETEVF